MDAWAKLTDFLASGMIVLPLTLGLGLGSFEAFAVTLGLMQIVLITAMAGAPVVMPANSGKYRIAEENDSSPEATPGKKTLRSYWRASRGRPTRHRHRRAGGARR